MNIFPLRFIDICRRLERIKAGMTGGARYSITGFPIWSGDFPNSNYAASSRVRADIRASLRIRTAVGVIDHSPGLMALMTRGLDNVFKSNHDSLSRIWVICKKVKEFFTSVGVIKPNFLPVLNRFGSFYWISKGVTSLEKCNPEGHKASDNC